MPLEPKNQKHIEAAQGYVELGMFMDANEDIVNSEPEDRPLEKWAGHYRRNLGKEAKNEIIFPNPLPRKP